MKTEMLHPVKIEKKRKRNILLICMIICTVWLVWGGIDSLKSFDDPVDYKDADVDTKVTITMNADAMFYPIVPSVNSFGSVDGQYVLAMEDNYCIITYFSDKQWRKGGFDVVFKDRGVGDLVSQEIELSGYAGETSEVYNDKTREYLKHYLPEKSNSITLIDTYLLYVGHNQYQNVSILIWMFAALMIALLIYILFKKMDRSRRT